MKKIIRSISVIISFIMILLIFSVITLTSVSASPVSTSYYGRQHLAKCGENLVGAYDAICSCVANRDASVSVKKYDLSKDDLIKVYKIYRFDHPEHYWRPNSYKLTLVNSVVSTVKFEYVNGLDSARFNAKVNELTALTKGASDDYSKALILHDALVKNTEYDLNGANIRNAYGALVDGKAVCEGYAQAYQLLLQQCGIQAYTIVGTAQNKAHQWTIVKLGGKYYQTDVTWDDPQSDGSSMIYHPFFNITAARMSENHQINDEYSMFPTCSSADMMYKDYSIVRKYTLSAVSDALKFSGTVCTAHIYFDGTTDNFNDWYSANKSAILKLPALSGIVKDISVKSYKREHVITMTLKKAVSTPSAGTAAVSAGSSDPAPSSDAKKSEVSTAQPTQSRTEASSKTAVGNEAPAAAGKTESKSSPVSDENTSSAKEEGKKAAADVSTSKSVSRSDTVKQSKGNTVKQIKESTEKQIKDSASGQTQGKPVGKLIVFLLSLLLVLYNIVKVSLPDR